MVLVRGLSPNSATVVAMQRGPVASGEAVRRVEGREATQAAFVRLFGPRKPPSRPS